MKLFITGGAGFIGSALLQAALKAGHSLTVFDNFSRGRREYCPADARVEVVEGDIRDRRRVREAITSDRPDAVIHLAGLHFIPDCIKRPQECLQINVDGTGNVLSAAAAVGVKRFVFASTAAVYAPTSDACVEKSTPLDPAEVYGQSKILGELLARGHHDRTRTAVTLLRLFNAIGPRETNPHILP
ncbi:MAG TPA: NAD-dependent epimerase/dehydratase family protein, partial [Polyangiaceae bacterium]|nr:NAD-dependent epimerase/dehydratase family protein [Polyangiaceae bacterium]